MTESGGVFVGLMSGTSLDGISAAVVRFADSADTLTHKLLAYVSVPYTESQRSRLAAAMLQGTAEEYCALDFDLGAWLAAAALLAMQTARVTASDVRAIASHGQTIWHSPRRATWQIGESAVIAESTGVGVVSDFRVRDVAAGGEGAPLVPIADTMLYNSAREWRLLQNIGGIANVTVVPPGGEVSGVRAFDTGPGVVLVDRLVRDLYPGLLLDEGGAIARSGRARVEVVATLLDDPYFAQSPPKSTGREYFGAQFAERLHRMVGDDAPREDVIATAVALTAQSIAGAVRRFVSESCREMLVSGGGARNSAIVAALRESIDPVRVTLFDDCYYDAEAKEAVAFALLGYLHLVGRAGNVTGATGARGPRVLGKWTPA
ncbi:MAG: anhydro-N-acetylmuramic acid kinase [Gemmatimonadaceae bacterium]